MHCLENSTHEITNPNLASPLIYCYDALVRQVLLKHKRDSVHSQHRTKKDALPFSLTHCLLL